MHEQCRSGSWLHVLRSRRDEVGQGQGQHPHFTNLEPLGQHDLQSVSRSLSSKSRVRSTSCRKTRHLLFDLLDPQLRLFLNFLEQRRLHGLGLLSQAVPWPAW